MDIRTVFGSDAWIRRSGGREFGQNVSNLAAHVESNG